MELNARVLQENYGLSHINTRCRNKIRGAKVLFLAFIANKYVNF